MDKKTILQSIVIPLFLFIGGAVAKPSIERWVNGYWDHSGNSKEKVKSEVIKVLDKYSRGLNTHSFDAYELFSTSVEEFITMKNTSPAEINNYINRYYYNQFLKPTTTFDKESLVVNYVDDNGAQVDVLENEEFIRAKSTKVEQHQTRTRIYFTKDYKIKVFTLYKIIF